MRDDLKSFFLDPQTPKHRQYEALRAYALEGLSAAKAAQRFGFTEKTLYALAHDLRAGKLHFFPPPSTGPKDRRDTPYVRDQIGEWRKSHLSVDDIVERLREDIVELSPSTVERILKRIFQGENEDKFNEIRGIFCLFCELCSH
jgi:transposase